MAVVGGVQESPVTFGMGSLQSSKWPAWLVPAVKSRDKHPGYSWTGKERCRKCQKKKKKKKEAA